MTTYYDTTIRHIVMQGRIYNICTHYRQIQSTDVATDRNTTLFPTELHLNRRKKKIFSKTQVSTYCQSLLIRLSNCRLLTSGTYEIND